MSNDVSVINTATNTLAATVLGVAALPEGLAIKP
jgi:YVTN family beta-propeller protein